MVQVPLDPENFDKVNYIIKAWARPCQAPWYIYVEALKPALLTAFITLATFGWDDVARGYFRPRGLGRRTGKRGKGRSGRALRGIPEPGDMIGKHLPGAAEIKGEKWSNLGKTLWRIDSLTQLGLFFWLVADVTEDLAFNFTSVLYETVWCQASTLGRFSYRRDDYLTVPGNRWWAVSYDIQDYEFPMPNWTVTHGFSGGSGAIVGATMSIKPRFAGDEATHLSIRVTELITNKVFAETGPGLTNPGGLMDIPVSGSVPRDTFFQVEVFHDADFALIGNGFVTGMQEEDT